MTHSLFFLFNRFSGVKSANDVNPSSVPRLQPLNRPLPPAAR